MPPAHSFDDRAYDQRNADHHSNRQGILGCRARAQRSIKPQKEAAPVCCLAENAVFCLASRRVILYDSLMKTTTLASKDSMSRSPLRHGLFLTALTLVCFALSPPARGTCQQGCLTNGNTVLGDDALVNNTTGVDNTAVGFQALLSNTTGSLNTATGWAALEANTTGILNTANGSTALEANTDGSGNTAVGNAALNFNRKGNQNTAIGSSALDHSKGVSSRNIALGNAAGTTLSIGNDNIYIGNPGKQSESANIRIGTTGIQTATFIAGISGATIPTGVAVIVDADGHLGTTTSSARYKEAIKPMDIASEAILALKPVTFRYKHELDPDGVPQFGLVAEDVEKVNPDLIARDDQGKPYAVRYEAVNAMLLNEFLKEHRKVESLENAMAEQQKENAAMRAMLKEQAAQIQKVSAELELSKVGPQTVLNNP